MGYGNMDWLKQIQQQQPQQQGPFATSGFSDKSPTMGDVNQNVNVHAQRADDHQQDMMGMYRRNMMDNPIYRMMQGGQNSLMSQRDEMIPQWYKNMLAQRSE